MAEYRSAKYLRNLPVEDRIKNARIPKRLRDVSLDPAQYPPAVREWLDGDGADDLYICGESGVGKSYLASGLLTRAIRKWGISGAFITTDRYLEACYDEIRNNGELPEEYSDPNMLKYLRRGYDLLVLDGIGDEKTTEFTIKAVTSLVISRYDNLLPTIVTSSRPPSYLSAIYGTRLTRVLKENRVVVLKEAPQGV
jgi:DNA replication protein DnaC